MTDIEKWAMGIVAALIVSGIGAWMNTIHKDLKDVSDKLDVLRVAIGTLTTEIATTRERMASMGERILVLERSYEALRNKLDRWQARQFRDDGDREMA